MNTVHLSTLAACEPGPPDFAHLVERCPDGRYLVKALHPWGLIVDPLGHPFLRVARDLDSLRIAIHALEADIVRAYDATIGRMDQRDPADLNPETFLG